MTKDEKKIQVVKQMLSSCVSSSANEYTYGDIPRKRFNGARGSYAYGAQYEDVIALIDTTVFGGGERGMVITLHDVYVKEMLTAPEHCKLSDVGNLTIPTETYYNKRNLCAMLTKLRDIENEPEYGFWNALGDIVGTVLEEGAKAVHNEYQKQRDAAEQEALAMFEEIRDSLETFRDDVIDEWIEEYDDIETGEEVVGKIIQITGSSCLLVNEYDKYKKICYIDEEEDTETIEATTQFMEVAKLLVDSVDEIFSESDDDEVEPLSRTFKRFNSSMIRIHGEMLDDADNDDVEELDLEEYYNRTQKAVKTLKKKVNVIIKCLNSEIEDAYED